MADDQGGTPTTPAGARLVMITGLPGAGKTTLALRLAAAMPAVRMCPDDWMSNAGIELSDREARALIEATQRTIALELLRAGRHVVIEFGPWSRSERDDLRFSAQAVGAVVELRYLIAPTDELWRRLLNRDGGEVLRSRMSDRHELDAYASEFEIPTADELVQYAAPWDLVD